MKHTAATQRQGRGTYPVMSLRARLGLEGYAVYAMTAEMIGESQEGEIQADAEVLAFALHAPQQLVESVIADRQLFSPGSRPGTITLAPSPEAAAELSRKRAEAGRKGMQSRWGTVSPQNTQAGNSSPLNTHAENSSPLNTLNTQKNSVSSVCSVGENNTQKGSVSSVCSVGKNNPNNTRITNTPERKETEKLPLHPLKEKDKERLTEEKKRKTGVEENKTKPGGTQTAGGTQTTNGTQTSNGTQTANGTQPTNGNRTADGNTANGGSQPPRPITQRDADCFMRYWNDALQKANSRLRPLRVIDRQRRRLLSEMRHSFTDEQIAVFVHQAARSPYLNARDGRLRQPADLNWMLASEERIVKIIEGNL